MANPTPRPPVPASGYRKGVPLLWFIIALIVAAGASGGGVYSYMQSATHLTVTGINWQIYVNNSSAGYLFHSEPAGCEASCPTNAQVNSVWTYSIPFAYGTAEYNLSVVNVTLPMPFRIVGISPGLPRMLTPDGASAPLHIAIQLPPDPGSYSVLGAVWVS